MKSFVSTPVPDISSSALTRHPYSLLGRTVPSASDFTPSLYRERPSSVTVLGKKIASDAVVTVNSESQFCPKPISFESAKPKQHFQRTKQLEDISNRPKSARAQSVISPKLLSKIKLYSNPETTSRENRKPSEYKPTKKPRPPKAPRRPTKSKDKKKAAVPKLVIEALPRPPTRESPHIHLVPKIDEIVQLTLKKTVEEKLREEELRTQRQREEHKKKQLLKQHNLKIRRANKRFQGTQFKPRSAWGTDERRIYGKPDVKSQTEARLQRELKLLKRKRAKSAEKDRIGLEALYEIKAELRPVRRSQSVIDRPNQALSGRTTTKAVREADPSVHKFMRQKKAEIKETYERECVSQMAMEAKRMSQLKNLDVKSKVALQKFKKRRKRSAKKKPILDFDFTEHSHNGPQSEDIEVIDIMNKLRGYDRENDLKEREGRESRVFGVVQQPPASSTRPAVQANASQVYIAEKGSERLLKPRANITMPALQLNQDTTSLHESKDLSDTSTFRHIAAFIQPLEDDSSLRLDLSDHQPSENSRRKDDIRFKLAELRKRADDVKHKVREYSNATPAYSEVSDLSGTPLNMPVLQAFDFEQKLRDEAAIKIQSCIRRFLAVVMCERLRADRAPQDLSFHFDEDEDFPKQSKFSDRLRIGVRTDWDLEDRSEFGLLQSSSHLEESEIEDYADVTDSEVELQQPSSDPFRRPRTAHGHHIEDMDQFLDNSRPVNPSQGDSEFSGSELEGEGEFEELFHELQGRKDKEQKMESIINQHKARQQAEEAKQMQIKSDLAKLRENDRKMLQDLAARSGASMLTGLLTNMFDQRYKRLEDLVKGNRNAIVDAIASDTPYFEQLEQCLKETENAQKSSRREASSIGQMWERYDEDSHGGIQTDQISQDELLSFNEASAKDDVSEEQRRYDFANEIAELERELYDYEQEGSSLKGLDLGKQKRPNKSSSLSLEGTDSRQQPISFEGMLAGSQQSQDPEQHISDLSADINDSYGNDSSIEVFNQPFSAVTVYISTEEDLNTSPIPHRESPVCLEANLQAFPTAPSRPRLEIQVEPEPSLPSLPANSSVSPNSPIRCEEIESGSDSMVSVRYDDINDILPELLEDLDFDSKEEVDQTQANLTVESIIDDVLEELLLESLDLLTEQHHIQPSESRENQVNQLADDIFAELFRNELLCLPEPTASLLPRHQLQKPHQPQQPLNSPEDTSPAPSRSDNLPMSLRNDSSETGLMTDPQTVLAYVDSIFARVSPNKRKFEQLLAKPLVISPAEMLCQLHNPDIIGEQDRHDKQLVDVLPVEVYLQLERDSEEAAEGQSALSLGTAHVVTEEGHIHNKMIFDAVNEVLVTHRLYGTKGIPMPWSTTTRELAQQFSDFEGVVADVKKKIQGWSAMQTGKLPGPDMLMSSGGIDEDFLQQVQEERLAACLATEMLESDTNWVDYEFEDTQVKLDLADIVLDHLVFEAFEVMQSVS